MTPTQAKTAIDSVGGRFFSVTFALKNKAKDGRPAGTLRDMLCRRRVKKYVKGIISPAARRMEDDRCEVLTVWDVQKFQELLKQGLPKMTAGRKSYRRINLQGIVSISIPLPTKP